ncbi:MAG: ABC transporter substrate-binding protein [Deltaproteobacteria bacterium]|nr:ABC transporter substrate-binding protein [Deltaproteobacteria bacterium]MBW2121724.1 ABC transporter substrate-binding protein [Deltaproteobacteria bacterium]
MSHKPKFAALDRRTFLKGVVAAGASLMAPWPKGIVGEVSAAKKRVVYTEQYGGFWEEHFKKNIFSKFTEKTGIEVVTVPGAGSKIARIDQMVKSGKVELDLLATDASDVIKGKRLGLWEKLNETDVPNLKKVIPALREKDDMSAPNISYWMILFYNTKEIKERPDSWEVLWDPKYKGWVTAYNDPGWSNIFPITAATMGITQEKLKKKATLDRVWKKLDRLKSQIKRWWAGGADFQQLAAAGEVWIGEAWNGRIFDSQDKGVPIDAVWPKEGGYLAIDHWTIVRGTPRRQEAMALLNFLLEPENQKMTAENLSYGPTTIGTVDMLDEKTRYRVYGPPGAIDKAIIEDWGWYFERQQYIETRWKEWIAL